MLNFVKKEYDPYRKSKTKKLDEDSEMSSSAGEEDDALENPNVLETPLNVHFKDRIHVADDEINK